MNLQVGNITSGVFSGMGRPIIATILSFGLELPLSIGGVAIYILVMHGDLLGVYWWTAISGALELIIVFVIFYASNWDYWSDEARKRQEAGGRSNEDNNDENTIETEDDTILQEPRADGSDDEQNNITFV